MRRSYHPLLEPLSDDPPRDDSEDLTDEEIAGAVDTDGPETLARLIGQEVRHDPESTESGGWTVKLHELRRRGEDLFWRSRLVSTQEPDKVLVYRVNWLQGG